MMTWFKFSVLAILSCAVLPAAHDPAFNWNDEGLAAQAHGDYAGAERLYLKAIERWRALGPDYRAHLAITEMNMAQARCAMGRREECANNLEDSLALFRQTLGVRNENALTAMNLLGGVTLMLENLDRARELFEEALPIERELYPQSIQMARTLGGLAALHLEEGNVETALPQAEEALRLTLAIDGENSVDAALEYANVAEMHRAMKHRDRALPLYRKSLAIYEKLLGPEHPRVGSILSQEGLLLMDDGKYALAEQAMLRARRIMDQSCRDCRLEQSVTLGNLGVLRYRQGRLDEADRLLTDALALEEKYMRPGPNMATTLEALAEIRKRERRFDEAARLKSRAAVMVSYR